jgi:hypothetical protein
MGGSKEPHPPTRQIPQEGRLADLVFPKSPISTDYQSPRSSVFRPSFGANTRKNDSLEFGPLRPIYGADGNVFESSKKSA